MRKNCEFESIFLNTPTGGLKSSHLLVQCGVDPMQWFDLGSSVGVVKQLLLNLPFMTKV